MNIFNLKITRNQSTHAKTYVSIDDVYVDEPHPIDLRELVRSCSESGRFFIFTCGCGDSGCANIHEGVQITRDVNIVFWRLRRPQSADGFDDRDEWMRASEEKVYTFAWSDYVTTIKTAVINADNSHPTDTEYSPYGFDRSDLHKLAVACNKI